MALSTFDKCRRILEALEEEGITVEVPARKLDLMIMKMGGSDPATRRRYLKTFVDTGLIKPHHRNPTFVIQKGWKK